MPISNDYSDIHCRNKHAIKHYNYKISIHKIIYEGKKMTYI